MLSELKSMWDGQLGRVDTAKHHIEILSPDTARVHSASYRAGTKIREFVKAKTEKMLAKKIVKPEQTECSVLRVFEPKKDGTLQLCFDYHKLNVVTERDSHPIAHIVECIYLLGEANLIFSFDANSRYWQTEIEDNNVNKTTFSSHHRVYRLVKMPFGL